MRGTKWGTITARNVGRTPAPTKPRRPGPDRGGAAAAARENTGLRTYRVTGEQKSPARVMLEERLATRSGMSKNYVRFLHYLLLGCA